MSKPTCSLCQFWHSSIGKKIIVALTGAVLAAFLLGHLTGNLLMYVGAEAFNEYAEFLHNMLHGVGVWIARISLLTCLVLHVAATISLVRANNTAKGQNYEKAETSVASGSSRIMVWSGLTILAFVIFHILHFTTRNTSARLKELGDTGDAYQMVIEGFLSIPVSLFYIIAISLLCSHLSHGVASIFQTLGLRTRNNASLINGFAKGYTALIWVGFISIPVAVLADIIK
ncbi:MAG: succinate dehydrogenase / fumarate reductase cytochrome b subunit [Cryomorphaceae bacterium]|jgi:succinate dehydrogenase / fumarate reductase cytochrome b subunit